MTEPDALQQVDRTYVRLRGRRLSYFSGCDYFRLGSNPSILRALREAANDFGLNVAASRLTTGNHKLYGQLEGRLCDFFGAPSALLVPTGYLAGIAVCQALAGDFSHALLDQKAHPALLDAARFLDCPVIQFSHRDAAQLESAVRRCGPGSKLILLTDGMFSHDGSVAPLREYLEVLPRDALVLVDDAHGAGVLGRRGRGTLEHAGVSRKRVIQTVTLSKAFGVYGGVILGEAWLRDRVLERSHSFTGSTPLPLPLAAAAMAALELTAKQGDELRTRLAEHASCLRDALRDSGIPAIQTPGPIVALVAKADRFVPGLKETLLKAAIYPPFIKYPGGARNGYFRFAIASEHTAAQLDRLAGVLTGWRDRIQT